jgi:hypothetical protein
LAARKREGKMEAERAAPAAGSARRRRARVWRGMGRARQVARWATTGRGAGDGLGHGGLGWFSPFYFFFLFSSPLLSSFSIRI